MEIEREWRLRGQAKQEWRVQKQDNGTPPDFGLSRGPGEEKPQSTPEQRQASLAKNWRTVLTPTIFMLDKKF